MSYNPYQFSDQGRQNIHPTAFSQQQQQPHHQAQQQGSNQMGYNQWGNQSYQQVPQNPQGYQNQKVFDDPRQTMAFQLGQTAFSNLLGQQNFTQFQDTVNKATSVTSNSISHYFQVSTSYVLLKIKLIIFPFFNNNNWQRIPEPNNANTGNSDLGGVIKFMTPMNDVNSPDMYIPIMGLVTYILIWNVQQGFNGDFNPENLYYKLSSTLAFVGLDLVILKLGLYLLVTTDVTNIQSVTSITELLCYVGYKFVPLTTILLLPNLYIPLWATLIFKIYLFIALGVFLLRSIKFNLFNNPNEEFMNIKKTTVRKCNYFLFFYGFVWQSILMWLIG
ncbi:hypothetical protein TPHA_0B04390 [Tetrapisispora phaffii CBS 4417]|uniref:Protein YIF1 n=1 Tax=Tetrapisispora phaffii (strain ATCC 24235 / CBS 4417 / NBRC 1672 / NRRL Y-8282 / UCD 70-5) TaxID=1071381 RepID=G8BQ27_TETPH|nr:hypothetical protein TPHA_0B04390 [Tetrapisispora phaffii CBS 4417]CCE62108.1 hypothetical protein TPHA_0B04390 [Tetrapisispora phaffii CBS 4417]